MATIQKAIKVGSSVAAVLPKTLLKEVDITAGMQITVESLDGAIIVRPVHARVRRANPSEDERVAETALGLIKRYRKALEQLANA